jgi:uncharacterized protein
LNENVLNEEQALQVLRYYCQWINENIYVRKQLRRLYQRKASITTSSQKQEEENAQKI